MLCNVFASDSWAPKSITPQNFRSEVATPNIGIQPGVPQVAAGIYKDLPEKLLLLSAFISSAVGLRKLCSELPGGAPAKTPEAVAGAVKP